MPLIIDTPYQFDNLIVVENNEEQHAYIIRYKPDLEWIRNKPQRGGFDTFTGILEVLSTNEEFRASTEYINGQAVNTEESVNGRVATCETWIDVVWTVVCVEDYGCNISEISWTEYEVCDDPGGGGGGFGGEGPDAGGGGGPTPIGGGDPGTLDLVDEWTLEDQANQNKLCGGYSFTSTGEGLTAEILGLGALATNNLRSLTLHPSWPSICVKFGSSTIVENSTIGSQIFNQAWNRTMDQTAIWLNTQSYPNTATMSAFVIEKLKFNLGLYSEGYVALSVGSCLGNIASTAARYCN